ncbi:MAG: flagellar filament capping protein FliD [Gammaproteobacteria bacterium]|nr:flagellar filament capping protein FliD [Gammaproteobacteria bacterium]
MAITAAGVGSGLDIEGIVTQLMTLERRPIVAIQQKVTRAEAEISSLGTFKSQLSTFQDAMQELGSLDAFRKFTTASTDDAVAIAEADGDAAAGIYNIDVTRLAQNHKQGSKEFASGATVGGTSGDALTLTVDGEFTTIDLSTASTLTELRDAINEASDNPGVTATILNVGGGNQRLILTADESGSAKHVDVSFGGSLNTTTFDFALANTDSEGATLTDLAELDAVFMIDGFALTSADNKIDDAIDGLTITLTGEGQTQLTLARDDAGIEESAKKFVDAYNALLNSIDALENREFSGNGVPRGVARGLRSVLNTSPTGLGGSFDSLSQVGILTNATTGDLEFNAEAFGDALDTDFSSVAQLFANDDQGFAFRFDALIESFLDSESGLIDARIDSLNDRKDTLESNEANWERRLELKEASLRSQYAALDSLVGSLQSTSSFLLQNLG